MLRALAQSDRDAMLEVWNDAADLDPITAEVLEEKVWGDATVSQDLCVGAESEGRLVGFAIAAVGDSGRGSIKLLAVAPAAQRKGIGSALLAETERRLVAQDADTVRLVEATPNYLVPGIDERNAAALRFAKACGYEPFGEACNLVVELAQQIEGPRALPDVELRRATATDVDALTSFLEPLWPSWQAEARTALENTPATVFIAVNEGAIIGFAAHDANNKGTGWFGPMGVSPDGRMAGVGRALLLLCLDDMREQGHKRATIAWADNVGFYEKTAGARIDRRFVRFQKTLAT